MDTNIVKLDKLIEINKSKPVSFQQFSVSTISGTGSAIGFNLENSSLDNFSTLDWSIILKIVNASKEDLIIEDIQSKWIGKNNYKSKSVYVSIYETKMDDDEVIVNQLLETKRDIFNNQILYPPFLLKQQSEKIVRLDFLMSTYKRVFLNCLLPTSFKRENIKAPETYEQLLQKAVISIKTNKNHKPLLLKI